jgi:hypothetical protein
MANADTSCAVRGIKRARIVIVGQSDNGSALAARLRRMDTAQVIEVPQLGEARQICRSNGADLCLVAANAVVFEQTLPAIDDAPGRDRGIPSVFGRPCRHAACAEDVAPDRLPDRGGRVGRAAHPLSSDQRRCSTRRPRAGDGPGSRVSGTPQYSARMRGFAPISASPLCTDALFRPYWRW